MRSRIYWYIIKVALKLVSVLDCVRSLSVCGCTYLMNLYSILWNSTFIDSIITSTIAFLEQTSPTKERKNSFDVSIGCDSDFCHFTYSYASANASVTYYTWKKWKKKQNCKSNKDTECMRKKCVRYTGWKKNEKNKRERFNFKAKSNGEQRYAELRFEFNVFQFRFWMYSSKFSWQSMNFLRKFSSLGKIYAICQISDCEINRVGKWNEIKWKKNYSKH